MNLDEITAIECILYYIQDLETVLNDGKLIGFEQEEIPTQTANQGGDNK